VKALDDPSWPVRRMAALALGEIGPPARPARAGLEKRLSDEQGPVRKAAAQALERLR
jgi:HEAT repeat protein